MKKLMEKKAETKQISEEHIGSKKVTDNGISYERFIDKLHSKEPIKEPPYTCPYFSENKKCQYPNCFCEWSI